MFTKNNALQRFIYILLISSAIVFKWFNMIDMSRPKAGCVKYAVNAVFRWLYKFNSLIFSLLLPDGLLYRRVTQRCLIDKPCS